MDLTQPLPAMSRHKKSPLRCSTRGHVGDPSLLGALPGSVLPGSLLGPVVTALRPTGLFVDNPGAASLGLHRTGRARFVTSPLPFANVGGGVPISCPPLLHNATLDRNGQVGLGEISGNFPNKCHAQLAHNLKAKRSHRLGFVACAVPGLSTFGQNRGFLLLLHGDAPHGRWGWR